MTTFNGLEDLSRDIITPFMRWMPLAGNGPVLKVYPDTGHFIHTDNPVQFAAAVVDFITLGNVEPSRRSRWTGWSMARPRSDRPEHRRRRLPGRRQRLA